MNALTVSYLALAGAIVCEVFATSMLQRSQQFTALVPSLLVIAGFAVSFYLLSHALRVIPLGVAYAIWAGTGIVLVAAIGVIVFRQSLDWPAIIGIGFIVTGVVIVNFLSKSIAH